MYFPFVLVLSLACYSNAVDLKPGIQASIRIQDSNLALDGADNVLKTSAFDKQLSQAWIVYPFSAGWSVIQNAIANTFITVEATQCFENGRVTLSDYTGESTQEFYVNDDGSISPACSKELVLYADSENNIVLREISDKITKTKFDMYVFVL